MGFDNDIGEEEKEAIHQLKEKIKCDTEPEIYEDIHLLHRFLKAQDFNLNNAEAMLRKHIEWREKNDLKNFMKHYKKPEVLDKYYKNVILGYDKEGCVVRYTPAGNLDLHGIHASSTRDELAKYYIYHHETDTAELKKQSEKLGRNIDKCVYIINFENFSFANATDKKVLLNMMLWTHLYINNYPDRLKAGYLINAPMCFYLLYTALKAILPKSLLSKMHVISDDSYKEELLKIIDADELPVFLGGNKLDPDGNPDWPCLNPEGRIPESYYIQKGEKKSLANAPDVQKLSLTRAAFHEVKLEVKEAGSYLEWEFETKCRDIGFGLFFNEMINGEEKVTELAPIQRIDTEEYPETGTFYCKHPGTYVIVFDNTYSLVRSKEIYYRAKVVTPKEHEDQLQE